MQSDPDSNPLPYSYGIEQIKTNNFHFVYTILEDDETFVYEGDRNQAVEQFTYQTKTDTVSFYKEGDLFFQLPDVIECPSPYRYSEFLDIKEIHRLLKNSTFLAKTEYSNQEIVYQYQLSTTSMLSLLKDQEVDLMDEVNLLSITLKDGEVQKVDLDFSSYLSYLKTADATLKIQLVYSDFGKISEIVSPGIKTEG